MNSSEQTPLTTRLARYVRTARLWLVWERYVPVFLWAAVFISVFLVGVFAGLWERIGDPWRGMTALTALIFLIHAAYTAQKRPLPSLSEARRRVERDSNQAHRPLDVLEDRPVIGEESWPAHYSKALKQSEQLSRPDLRPTIAPRDPYFLRFILPLALVLALLIGSGANMERLRRAVTPVWQAGVNPDNVTYEAWIDPPDYTGRPPIYFQGQDIKTIPAGSEWVARLNGAKSVPRPKLRQGGDTDYLRINKLSRETFEARAFVSESGEAVWRIGQNRKVWKLNVVQDQLPIVTLDETPKADKQDRLVITYSFKDDYGVTNLSLEMIEIVDGVEEPFAGSSLVEIPMSGGSVPKAEAMEAKLDLTRHPLAGKKVVARLKATDGAGQSAYSSESWFRVPDKIFVEPLAKAVVEQRAVVLEAIEADYKPESAAPPLPGQIFSDTNAIQRLKRAPEGIERAANLIGAVTDRPEGLFRDPSVYLGLRNVRSRLRYARNLETVEPIPDELWSIALRAEYGTLGTALEEMREAEQALREGMARRAPQREIDTLFERYNSAVEAYTEELKRKALEDGNFAEQENIGGGGGSMGSTDEIQELLKAIEEANKAGDVEGARRALAQLAQVLENMEIQLSQSAGGGGEGFEGEMSEQMKENLEELADLLGEQRELQDETDEAERQAQEDTGGNGSNDRSRSPQSGLSPGELASRQEELEELLGRLGKDDGEAAQIGAESDDQTAGNSEENGEGGNQPGDENRASTGGGTEAAQDELDRARDGMSRAADALSQGDYPAARSAQEDAVQAMRDAGEKLAESARGEGQGESGESGQGNDPLGRQQGGDNSENAEADIDQRDNASRSRELLEELRRRAAERERRQEERDYIERLLDRF